MKLGRPNEFSKPVTITVMIEETSKIELDDMRGRHSRGRYISILAESDNLKTRKILDLKDQIDKCNKQIISLQKNAPQETVIDAFRKSIYSHFRAYSQEYIEDKMGGGAKKMWAEKLKTDPRKLKDFLW